MHRKTILNMHTFQYLRAVKSLEFELFKILHVKYGMAKTEESRNIPKIEYYTNLGLLGDFSPKKWRLVFVGKNKYRSTYIPFKLDHTSQFCISWRIYTSCFQFYSLPHMYTIFTILSYYCYVHSHLINTVTHTTFYTPLI